MAKGRKHLSLLLAVTAAVACSKKDDKESTTTGTTVEGKAAELTSGSLVLDYALTALSSAAIDTESSTLRLDSYQSEDMPRCSNNGEPWDTETNQRMQPSNPKFSETTFYCQLNFGDSPETIRGIYGQNGHILCDVYRVLGSDVEYTEAGKEYTDVSLTLTEACGWAADMVAEVNAENEGAGLKATITAKKESGDWDKSIAVSVPGMIGFKLLWKVATGAVSFKKVEGWSQAERKESGDSNEFLADDATGTRGGVVTIDMANGVLRAETGDNYWSRRVRMYVKGAFDTSTGTFSSIDEGWGIQGNFDKSDGGFGKGLYGEFATVSGNSTDGFMFRSYRMNCSGDCDVESEARTETSIQDADNVSVCLPSGKTCTGNDGITLGVNDADMDFMMLGKAWDDQGGTTAEFESWIEAAKPLTFDAITKAPTVE